MIGTYLVLHGCRVGGLALIADRLDMRAGCCPARERRRGIEDDVGVVDDALNRLSFSHERHDLATFALELGERIGRPAGPNQNRWNTWKVMAVASSTSDNTFPAFADTSHPGQHPHANTPESAFARCAASCATPFQVPENSGSNSHHPLPPTKSPDEQPHPETGRLRNACIAQ